jgi:probable HAF family extracellular repeat protein
MWFSSWLEKRGRSTPSGRSHKPSRKRSSFRPRLEALEDRTVPSGGYVFKTIDDPNAVTGITTSGINSRGDVVGTFYDVNGNPHGFLRTSDGQYTTIQDPPNAFPGSTVAYGINDREQIVGSYSDATIGAVHGFLRSRDGQYTQLDDPNSAGFTVGFTVANGINAPGQIVGYYYDAKNFVHGFLLSGGQYTNIDDPNAAGFTDAFGINARGQIVGAYDDASGALHGFLRSRDGHYTTLDDPSGVYTSAFGINDRGQIVGYYIDVNGEAQSFLLSDGQYTTLDDPNAAFTGAQGINDSGKIVGIYTDANGAQHGFLATPQNGGHAQRDAALTGPSLAASQVSGGSTDVFLAAADLTNATLTSNQVIHVGSGSGANRNDDWSRIATGPTWAVATVPSTLSGSGDSAGGRVPVVAATGADMGLTGNDAFVRNDDVFRVYL